MASTAPHPPLPVPIGALILAFLVGSCGPGPEPGTGDRQVHSSRIALEAALADSPRWVDHYEPDQAAGGYNLALFRRQTPFLMDMGGALVHAWPDVRVGGRARLLPDGHLASINALGGYEEHDWEGHLTWSFRPRGAHFVHHDFAPLRNGNVLLIVRRPRVGTDYLLEIDRSGREVWRWETRDALEGDLWRAEEIASPQARGRVRRDRTHLNSVHELPPNRWFDAGHEPFRPGNILVSARALNTLYIVARPGGEVVWKHDEGLDYQHEGLMIPEGLPGAGNVVFFNNGYHNLESFRRSAIVELDPVERSVAWRYDAPGFFSSVEGTQQILPGGNLLVTSSRGGRVFELTRDRRIVWQWAPASWLPMRVSRYPYDFCPQLASIGRPTPPPVRRRDPERHLDADLYSFALAHDRRPVLAKGRIARVLSRASSCQTLRLPGAPELSVGYGIVRRKCETDGRPARFSVSLRAPEATSPEVLWERDLDPRFDDGTDPGAPVRLRRQTLSLARFEGQTVELCLTLSDASGGPPPPCFAWGVPEIRPAGGTRAALFEDEKDPEILEHQREQLEALGYIN